MRQAVQTDVAELVAIHQQSFQGFFLTSLGPRFLGRFYRALIAEPRCICLVAAAGARTVGFAVGPLDPVGFFRRLFIRQGLGFALDAMPAIMRRPRGVAGRLLRGVRFRGDPPARSDGAALLSSIAVHPSSTGVGVADRMIEEFCRQAATRGASMVYLTTDRDGNSAVNRLYRRHGFELESELQRSDGRAMNRYVRRLDAGVLGERASPDAQDARDE